MPPDNTWRTATLRFDMAETVAHVATHVSPIRCRISLGTRHFLVHHRHGRAHPGSAEARRAPPPAWPPPATALSLPHQYRHAPQHRPRRAAEVPDLVRARLV